MNSNDLLDAMGGISDHQILENQPRRKIFNWVKWTAIAACLALVISIPLLVHPMDQAPSDRTDPTESVSVLPFEFQEQDIALTPLGPLTLGMPESELPDAFVLSGSDSEGVTDESGHPVHVWRFTSPWRENEASVQTVDFGGGFVVFAIDYTGGFDWRLPTGIQIGSPEETVLDKYPNAERLDIPLTEVKSISYMYIIPGQQFELVLGIRGGYVQRISLLPLGTSAQSVYLTSEDGKNRELLRSVSIGSLYLGASADYLTQALKSYEVVKSDPQIGPLHITTQTWTVNADPAPATQIRLENRGEGLVVNSIMYRGGCDWRLPDGITVGSTEADVLRCYPYVEPLKVDDIQPITIYTVELSPSDPVRVDIDGVSATIQTSTNPPEHFISITVTDGVVTQITLAYYYPPLADGMENATTGISRDALIRSSVGSVSLGMEESEVEALLGQPSQVMEARSSGQTKTCFYDIVPDDPDATAFLQVAYADEGDGFRVYSVYLDYGSDWTAALDGIELGVRVGDSEAALARLTPYLQVTARSDGQEAHDCRKYYYQADDLELYYNVTDGLVTGIGLSRDLTLTPSVPA